jgi:adhesin/invasin
MRVSGLLLTLIFASPLALAASVGGSTDALNTPASPASSADSATPFAAAPDVSDASQLLAAGAQLAQSIAAGQSAGSAAFNQAAGIGVNTAQSKIDSFMHNYLPTFEMDMGFAENNKPAFGILGVVPLRESTDHTNALFSQLSTFRTDDRTTVNVGFGDRQLVDNDRVLLGLNAFYDYEFPYANQRSSVGMEVRTTVAELNANLYQGLSGWKIASDGIAEKAMGGYDVEAGVALPYLPRVEAYEKHFQWNAFDGQPDITGNVLSLKGNLIPGLTLEVGRTYYSSAAQAIDPDANFVSINLDIVQLLEHSHASEPFLAEQAYSLDSMQGHLYDKVRRENIIQKQSGRGFIISASGS